jgi:hypothetical protein
MQPSVLAGGRSGSQSKGTAADGGVGRRLHSSCAAAGKDQCFGYGQGQVNQRDAKGTGNGLDHFARGFLESPLDLGEVLRGQAGPRGDFSQRHTAVVTEPSQQLTEDLPPQGLRRCAGRVHAGVTVTHRSRNSECSDVSHA